MLGGEGTTLEGAELRGKQEVIVNGGVAWLNAQVHTAVGGE